MSLYDYGKSKEIDSHDFPFKSLIMAAIRKADNFNLGRLEESFPEIVAELKLRYNSPGGRIEGD